jgi:fructokinase
VILVAGEALYDLVLQGTDDRLQADPGGGSFNTARTIGRLGRPVAYLGRLSRDRFGRRLEAILAEDGVDLQQHRPHRRAHDARARRGRPRRRRPIPLL